MTLNDRIATKASAAAFTMPFFWGCVVLVTVPLVFPAAMPVVQYISSGYLQLILLPLIGVAAVIADRAASGERARIEAERKEDHAHITAMLQEVHRGQVLLAVIACETLDEATVTALCGAETLREVKDLRDLHPRGADRFGKTDP